MQELKLDSFTGVKACLQVSVMVIHMYTQFFPKFEKQANSAVAEFICLSGFFGYLSVSRMDQKISNKLLLWIQYCIRRLVPLAIILYTLHFTLFRFFPLHEISDTDHNYSNRIFTHTWTQYWYMPSKELFAYRYNVPLYFISILAFMWLFVTVPVSLFLKALSDGMAVCVFFISLLIPALVFYFGPHEPAWHSPEMYFTCPWTHLGSFIVGMTLCRARFTIFSGLLRFRSFPFLGGLLVDGAFVAYVWFQRWVISVSWHTQLQSVRFQWVIPPFALGCYLISCADLGRYSLTTRWFACRYFKQVAPGQTLMLVYVLHTTSRRMITWPDVSYKRDYGFSALLLTFVLSITADMIFAPITTMACKKCSQGADRLFELAKRHKSQPEIELEDKA